MLNVLPKEIIDELTIFLKNELSKQIVGTKISYKASGHELETLTKPIAIDYFTNNKNCKLIYKKIQEDKNTFPDLIVKLKLSKYDLDCFFEVKAADSHKGPGNDLGTLNSLWVEHIIKDIKIDNIKNLFMIFVKYTHENGIITRIDDVYIAHYFKFIGISKVKDNINIFKYREKDGNLRPILWSNMKNIKDTHLTKDELYDFIVKYFLTNIYRSHALVKKHKSIIKKFSDIKLLSEMFMIDKLGIDKTKISHEIQSKMGSL